MDEETYPEPTLEIIHDWWLRHPETNAIRGSASACIIAKPLADFYSRDVTYVPVDGFVTVWRTDDEKRANVKVPRIFGKIARKFDEFHGRVNEAVSGEECLRMVEAEMKKGTD